jgi:hypothetical protein
MVITQSALDKLVQTTLQASIFSAKVDLLLFTNNIAISKATVLSQLVEATFSGYSRVTAYTFGANPILQADGSYSLLGALATFRATSASPFVQNTVYGWAMVDDATGLVLYGAELFAQPQAIVQPDDGFGLVVSLNQIPPNVNNFGTLIL